MKKPPSSRLQVQIHEPQNKTVHQGCYAIFASGGVANYSDMPTNKLFIWGVLREVTCERGAWMKMPLETSLLTYMLLHSSLHSLHKMGSLFEG